MDIEKLIERLRNSGWTNPGMTDKQSLEWDAADALYALQAKYKSRDYLVDRLEDDVARLLEENEKLKEELRKYEVR